MVPYRKLSTAPERSSVCRHKEISSESTDAILTVLSTADWVHTDRSIGAIWTQTATLFYLPDHLFCIRFAVVTLLFLWCRLLLLRPILYTRFANFHSFLLSSMPRILRNPGTNRY